MNVLECHSKGDKRFSAFYAKVTIHNKLVSIENFYQEAKRLPDGTIAGKGNPFHHLVVFDKIIPAYYVHQFYDMLWVQYFMENPSLLEYAKTFDDYRDIFKGHSINNQEDTIRRICKEGLDKVYSECKPFKSLISSSNKIPTLEGDIFNCSENIIAHQTNCKGVMGAGIAKSIKNKYPSVFEEYKYHCSIDNQEINLGTIQVINIDENKYVANLFGQYAYGRTTRQTDYEALTSCFKQLGIFARDNNLSIAVPFKIGCVNAGGDWNIVENIIDKTIREFNVPIVLYKFVDYK